MIVLIISILILALQILYFTLKREIRQHFPGDLPKIIKIRSSFHEKKLNTYINILPKTHTVL